MAVKVEHSRRLEAIASATGHTPEQVIERGWVDYICYAGAVIDTTNRNRNRKTAHAKALTKALKKLEKKEVQKTQ